jgi:hypothetical protein
MNAKNSRCIICGKFFDSMKEVKEHKDKEHRITNSKIIARLKGLIHHDEKDDNTNN